MSADQLELRTNILDFARRSLSGETDGDGAVGPEASGATCGALRRGSASGSPYEGVRRMDRHGDGDRRMKRSARRAAITVCSSHACPPVGRGHAIIAIRHREQRERYFRASSMARGSAHTASASPALAPILPMRARAVKQGDDYVLNGTKTFGRTRRLATCSSCSRR